MLLFWIGYVVGVLAFTGIVLWGDKLVVFGIVSRMDWEFGWRHFGQMGVTLLFYFSPLVLAPLMFSHYDRVGVQVFFSIYFVIFALVCMTAAAIRVARWKEFYEIYIVRTIKAGAGQRWRAISRLTACLLVLAVSEPYTTGVIKSVLYESHVLRYRFSGAASEAVTALREYRASQVEADIASCVELLSGLSSVRGRMLEGSSRYKLPSGGELWAQIQYPTDVGDVPTADVYYASKDSHCIVGVDLGLAEDLDSKKRTDIRPLLPSTTRQIEELKAVKARAPIGILMGALFGYFEILETLKAGDFGVEPDGVFSRFMDRCILAGDIAIIALAFLVVRRKSVEISNPQESQVPVAENGVAVSGSTNSSVATQNGRRGI